MMPTNTRKYRLEVAVKNIHGLVQLGASARVVFSVRFLNFNEIFIRPHTASGGGIAETSPDGTRILTLTYNVCHRADFIFNDDDCRQFFPANCICSVFDEAQPNAPLKWTWTCPCPLTTTERAAAGWHHTSYAMHSASGQIMGYANMSCRVVALDAVVASDAAQTAGAIAPSVTASPAISGGNITSNSGKPYVIRVVLDNHSKANGNKTKKLSSAVEVRPSSATERTMKVAKTAIPVSQEGWGLVLEEKDGTASKRNVDAAHRSGGTAKKKTLLYLLKYDVAYQIQSNCTTLYAILIREFASLDAVSVNEKAKPMTQKMENMVHSISRLANIALQLVNQYVELAGETYTDISSQAKGRRNPVNKLEIPREGSVAQFLVYQVLFQLQCLGTNLCHVTSVYERTLEVPLSALHKQHYNFIHRLSEEVRDLSKCINIIVQSTIDGTFGADSKQTYSSSFSSTHGKSSRLSSVASSSSIESSVESVHSATPMAPSVPPAKSTVQSATSVGISQTNSVGAAGAGYTFTSNALGTLPFSPPVPSAAMKTESSTFLPSAPRPSPPVPETTTTTTTKTGATLFQPQPMSTIKTQESTGKTTLTGLGAGAEAAIGLGTGKVLDAGIGKEIIGVPTLQLSPHAPPIASANISPPSLVETSRGRALDNTLPPSPPSLSVPGPQTAQVLTAKLQTPSLEPTLPLSALTPSASTLPIDMRRETSADKPSVQMPIAASKPLSLGAVLDTPLPPPVGLSSPPISHYETAPSPPSIPSNYNHLQVPSNTFTPSQPTHLPVPLPTPTMPNSS